MPAPLVWTFTRPPVPVEPFGPVPTGAYNWVVKTEMPEPPTRALVTLIVPPFAVQGVDAEVPEESPVPTTRLVLYMLMALVASGPLASDASVDATVIRPPVPPRPTFPLPPVLALRFTYSSESAESSPLFPVLKRLICPPLPPAPVPRNTLPPFAESCVLNTESSPDAMLIEPPLPGAAAAEEAVVTSPPLACTMTGLYNVEDVMGSTGLGRS